MKKNTDILHGENEKKGLGIYVHIPFCVKKCNYCDFLSFPDKDGSMDKKDYLTALEKEIKEAASMYSGIYQVDTIFFGGGTPTILSGKVLGGLLKQIRDSFFVQKEAEITTEANPGTVDIQKLKELQEAGFNRISFGCQSVHDTELKKLGRIHTFEQFLTEYQAARKAGFDNINVDLISAIPDQTLESWRENLKVIASLQPEHISAYSLIIEEGTPFFYEQNRLNLPDEETERRMYEETADILALFGYEQYEISNYAKPGKICKHNLAYWQGKPYVGLGLGGASFMPDDRYMGKETFEKNQQWIRFSNVTDMKAYIAAGGNLSKLHEIQEVLDREDLESEYMILGLRMTNGVSVKEFKQRFGISMEERYGEIIKKYQKLKLLDLVEDRLQLTRAGISVSNQILADFLCFRTKMY